MAIKFVNVEAAPAPDLDGVTAPKRAIDEAPEADLGEVAEDGPRTIADVRGDARPDDAESPATSGSAPRPPGPTPDAPRPARRRRKAEARDSDQSTTQTAGEDAAPPETGRDAPADATALPGFEDRPKPSRRRGPRPYWGFG